ncbi:hypothetical protein ScPMuIL_015937 [Solemya velum]
MAKFVGWLNKAPRRESRDILSIPVVELDTYIGAFLLSLRKKDGTDYEPDTITSFHRGVDRYPRDNKYPHDIIKSRLFGTSGEILKGKRTELKEKGPVNKPNRAEPISDNEEDKLGPSVDTGGYFVTHWFGENRY